MASEVVAHRGRILVSGGLSAARPVAAALSREGFASLAVDADQVVANGRRHQAQAIVLTGPVARARAALGAIRADAHLRHLPVIADLSRSRGAAMRSLDVEDWVRSPQELVGRVQAALAARRLVERDQLARRRMEVLLEITQAATSSLELDQILGIAVERIGKLLQSERVSVVLVEGEGPRVAKVVATREVPQSSPFPIDLARYPELRRALETRQMVHVEDTRRDPLMAGVRRHLDALGVRSVLVQPLICNDDLLGALFLRVRSTHGAFAPEDLEFARTVAAQLANSIRNARLHAAVRTKREELESAYVDRYRDLSEANKRLKELNRVKDDVLAVVSHDLRAPLQVLLGHGQLLADSDALDASARSSVEAIVRQGRKILELAENLLERGRKDAGNLALDAREIDVAELCKEACDELQILAKKRGLALRAETPEVLSAVADAVKLRQVLQNLVTNALHHAREAGEVVVRAQRQKHPEGDLARVVVHDDGAGIPEEQLHVVFDKYRSGGGGTGLGLAICRELVELHGGEIWAHRPATGGTDMVFTVPLMTRREPAAPPPVEAGGRSPRVLVVEDEPEVAAAISEILRSRYRVELARDGAEGLAKARAQKPDLVVMDVILRRLDGLDVAVALKQSADTADVPVILLSSKQETVDKVRALNLGAVDYVRKPCEAPELLARVDKALRLRAAERELARSLALLRRGGSDPDTGLFDRAGFVSRLEQERARSLRYDRKVALALLRPPRTLEQSEARSVAQWLRRSLRVSDVVGHLGGGLLAVLLPESTLLEARPLLARLIRELLAESGLQFSSVVNDLQSPEISAEAALDGLVAQPAAHMAPK